jgi:hypothetical protein
MQVWEEVYNHCRQRFAVASAIEMTVLHPYTVGRGHMSVRADCLALFAGTLPR